VTTVYGFVRRYLVFNFAVMTAMAFSIKLLFGEPEGLGLALTFSYCIGGFLFLLLMVLRVFVLQTYTLSAAAVFLAHVAVIPIAMMAGAATGTLITGRGVGNWTTATLFTLIGASFSILNMVSVERHRRASRAERMAVAAQLQVLQAQIEPHFLFNTLASLNELIATDAERAQEMLRHLNRYLRASLVHVRSDVSTLGTEFDLLRAYLAIMEIRLQRLRASVDCAGDCTQLTFPPMLVQPLVENAVTHGIEPLREGGEVRVRAYRSEDLLIVTVEDSGAGLNGSSTPGAGTGIQTIRDRLHALFGTEASLELVDLTTRGTRAQIEIPIRLLSRGVA
jgi:LytS/YehU family sensor histidine kinase